jgi:hypothetical protein
MHTPLPFWKCTFSNCRHDHSRNPSEGEENAMQAIMENKQTSQRGNKSKGGSRHGEKSTTMELPFLSTTITARRKVQCQDKIENSIHTSYSLPPPSITCTISGR